MLFAKCGKNVAYLQYELILKVRNAKQTQYEQNIL